MPDLSIDKSELVDGRIFKASNHCLDLESVKLAAEGNERVRGRNLPQGQNDIGHLSKTTATSETLENDYKRHVSRLANGYILRPSSTNEGSNWPEAPDFKKDILRGEGPLKQNVSIEIATPKTFTASAEDLRRDPGGKTAAK